MASNPWSYSPSPAAAMVFLVLFAIGTLWHAAIMIRKRAWFFIPFLVGGILEVVGYATRFLGAKDRENLTFFIIQTLAILVSPSLLAASIYMALGRLVRAVQAENHLAIRSSWTTKIFVGGDIVSFLIQVAGSSMLSSNFSLGKIIILAGLITQLIFFGLFVITAAVFYRRLGRRPTEMASRLDISNRKRGWRGIMEVLFFASGLIFIRSVFRLIEFTGDHNSPMMTSEAYLYICDSTLMVGVLAVLIYLHPSKYILSRPRISGYESELL